MAALLARWVNNEVGLSRKVTNLDADFSTGYLLAELLVALGYHDDISEFSRRASTSVRTANYKRLVPILRQKLGISLTKKAVTDIVTEQRGSMARLLYKIKTVHDQRVGAPGALPVDDGRKRHDGADVDGGQRKKWVRPEVTEPDLLQTVVADPSLPYNQKVMTLHTHGFVQERLRQDAMAHTLEAQEVAQLAAEAAERHRAQRDEFKDKRAFMDEWMAEREVGWRATQRVKQSRERTELKFELTMAEKQRRLRNNVRNKHTKEVVGGIDEFEKNMKRMGSGPKSPRELTKADFQDVEYERPYDMQRRLSTKFKEDHNSAEVVGYYQDVKAKIQDDRVARRERQTRRRKMMVDQQRSQAAVEVALAEQRKIDELLAVGRAERRAAEQLWRQQYEEQRRTREMLASLETEEVAREQAFQRTLARDREFYRAKREQRLEATKAERAARDARLAEARRVERERNEALCADVADMILDTAYAVADFKEAEDMPVVPMPVWEAIKADFVSGAIAAARQASENAAELEAERERTGDPLQWQLDTADVAAYQAGAQGWQRAAATVSDSLPSDATQAPASAEPDAVAAAAAAALMAVPSNPVCGEVQRALVELVEGEVPEYGSPPPVVLGVCVVGGPLTGKTSVARKLEKQYYLRRVTAEDVIGECQAAFDAATARAAKEEAGEEVQPLPERSPAELAEYETMLGLGATATAVYTGGDLAEVPAQVAALTGGGKKKKGKAKAKGKGKGKADDAEPEPFRPDAVLLDAVVESEAFTRALALIVSRIATACAASHAAVASDQSQPRPGCGGWVLDGFPRSKAQALALECVLGGPLKTHMPAEWNGDVSALLGALGDGSWAPPPPPSSEAGDGAADAADADAGAGVELASALDLVVVMHASADVVAKRAAGRLLDARGADFEPAAGAGGGDGDAEGGAGDDGGEGKGEEAKGGEGGGDGGDEAADAAPAPFAGFPYPVDTRSAAWDATGVEAGDWFRRTGAALDVDTDESGEAAAFGAADAEAEARAAARVAAARAAEAAAAREAAIGAVVAELEAEAEAARKAAEAEAGDAPPAKGKPPKKSAAEIEEEERAAAAAAAELRARAEARVSEAEAKEAAVAAAAAATAPVDWSQRLASVAVGDDIAAQVRRSVVRGEEVDVGGAEALLKHMRDVDKQWQRRVRLSCRCLRGEQAYTKARLQHVRRSFLRFLRRPLRPRPEVTETMALSRTGVQSKRRRQREEPIVGARRLAAVLEHIKSWRARDWGDDDAVGALYDDIDEAEAELWSFAEDRGERAVSLLQGLRHDGWVEQRTRALCAVAEALMACEVNRVMNESGVMAQVAGTVLPSDRKADAGPWLRAAARVVADAPPADVEARVASRRQLCNALREACAAINTELQSFAGQASGGVDGGDDAGAAAGEDAAAGAAATNPVVAASVAAAAVVAWQRVLRVAVAADMACAELEAAAEATWEVMDGYISARLKAVNANVAAVASAAREVLSTGDVEAGAYVTLSEADDIAAPWGTADDRVGGENPEPLPGADLGDDPSVGVEDCGEMHLVDGRMDVVAAIAEDAAARQSAFPPSAVFDSGPLLQVPSNRLQNMAGQLCGVSGPSRRSQKHLAAPSAFVEALQRLAEDSVLPPAWMRVPAAALHASARTLARGGVLAGGSALDVRLAVLSLAYGGIASLPTPAELARMVTSLQAAAKRDDGSIRSSLPPSVLSDVRLWFQRQPSRGDDDASRVVLGGDAAGIKVALAAAWSDDDGRFDWRGFLLDSCCDPANGAAAPASLEQLRQGTNAATGGPYAYQGLYKAFVVTALLEGRLAGVPGEAGGSLPVWQDVAISTAGFRALLQREKDRGMPIPVDQAVDSHSASSKDGTVSFDALVAAQPAWLSRDLAVAPYTLSNAFADLLQEK